jgi:hypothetical protein
MSRGKYSLVYQSYDKNREFKYNCYGKDPKPWNKEIRDSGVLYDQKEMFDCYDSEGYDSYGYSSFDYNGNYIGPGDGIDKDGYTEYDYLTLQDLSEYERKIYYDYN